MAKVGYLFPRSYGAWRKGSTAVNVVASSPMPEAVQPVKPPQVILWVIVARPVFLHIHTCRFQDFLGVLTRDGRASRRARGRRSRTHP